MSLFVRNQDPRSELQIRVAADLKDRIKDSQLKAVQEPPKPVDPPKDAKVKPNRSNLYAGLILAVLLLIVGLAVINM